LVTSTGSKIDPSGTIDTVAGSGCCGDTGDGGPAIEAKIEPSEVAIGADGSIYVSDGAKVRVVTTDGIITTVAGGGCCGSGDGGFATKASLRYVLGLGTSPDGSYYIADGRAVVRRVGVPPSSFVTGEQILPSEDGSQVFVFDARGRHLRTLDALTNAVLYRFEYDSAGLLTAVVDVHGNETTIERDNTGAPMAIISPYGQTTDLVVDPNGYLSSVTDPAGNSIQVGHSASGLLTSFTDARGNAHSFTFNEVGRLTLDDPPGPGATSLSRSGTGNDYSVLSEWPYNHISCRAPAGWSRASCHCLPGWHHEDGSDHFRCQIDNDDGTGWNPGGSHARSGPSLGHGCTYSKQAHNDNARR
jgi:YD repeat-containing protein